MKQQKNLAKYDYRLQWSMKKQESGGESSRSRSKDQEERLLPKSQLIGIKQNNKNTPPGIPKFFAK